MEMLKIMQNAARSTLRRSGERANKSKEAKFIDVLGNLRFDFGEHKSLHRIKLSHFEVNRKSTMKYEN